MIWFTSNPTLKHPESKIAQSYSIHVNQLFWKCKTKELKIITILFKITSILILQVVLNLVIKIIHKIYVGMKTHQQEESDSIFRKI